MMPIPHLEARSAGELQKGLVHDCCCLERVVGVRANAAAARDGAQLDFGLGVGPRRAAAADVVPARRPSFLLFLNVPIPLSLLGGRYVVEALADAVPAAFGLTLTVLIVLLGLQLLVRRLWIALIVFSVIRVIITPTGESAGYSASTSRVP